MCLAAANATAAGRANRNRREEFTAGAIAKSRQLADDLVEARVDVIGKLNFGDRPQAVDAHADRRADDAAFGNRCVDDPVLAILALQSVGAAEHAAEIADILAENDDVRVLVHHDVERGADGLDHVHLCHYDSSDLRACAALRLEMLRDLGVNVIEHRRRIEERALGHRAVLSALPSTRQ